MLPLGDCFVASLLWWGREILFEVWLTPLNTGWILEPRLVVPETECTIWITCFQSCHIWINSRMCAISSVCNTTVVCKTDGIYESSSLHEYSRQIKLQWLSYAFLWGRGEIGLDIVFNMVRPVEWDTSQKQVIASLHICSCLSLVLYSCWLHGVWVHLDKVKV